MDELIQNCWLPEEFRNYRVKQFMVYDIGNFFLNYKKYWIILETLEEDKSSYLNDQGQEDRMPEAYLRTVSIATASNIPEDEPRYFERASSTLESEQELVNNFMDHLFAMHRKFAENIPVEIFESLEELDRRIKSELDKEKKKRHMSKLMDYNRFRRHLLSYSVLNIYGFNSGIYYLLKFILWNFNFQRVSICLFWLVQLEYTVAITV